MPPSPSDLPPNAAQSALSIAAMDVHFPGCADLAAFEYAVYTGKPFEKASDPASTPIPETPFWSMQSIDISQLAGEDQLLLEIIARLSQKLGSSRPMRIALIIGRAAPLLEAVADRIEYKSLTRETQQRNYADTILCQFSGPVIDLSMEGNFLAAALTKASALLSSGSTDQVIVAAASLSLKHRGLFSAAGVKLNSGPSVMGFDRSVEGWTCGDGAAGLVLRSAGTDPANWATIESLGLAVREQSAVKKFLVPTFVSSDAVARCAEQALQKTGLTVRDVGYLEVLGSGFLPVDTAELGGLSRVYQTNPGGTTCALGSAAALVGHVPVVSGLASLIRASLCLRGRFIPATPGWTGPKKADLWDQTPFYIAQEQRAWLLTGASSQRIAAVNSIGWDGSCAHILLSAPHQNITQKNNIRSQSPGYLAPIRGSNREDLLAALTAARQQAEQAVSPAAFARQAYERYASLPEMAFCVSIVGQDLAGLQKELEQAMRDVPNAFDKGRAWQTPAGSCFALNPVGQQGGLAFVYPGAFNSYLGLGRDLFQLYPEIYAPAAQLSRNLGATIQQQILFPAIREALDKDQQAAIESQLNADPIAMITSGSLIAVLFTMILRDVYKIQAGSAFGYSLGEIGMLFSSGIWNEADDVSAALSSSSLFQKRISGPMNAVRDHWALPHETGASSPIWANFFLMGAADAIADAVASEPRVYLTHINTPRQVVIGGEPEACQRVIAALKCTSLRAPFDFALHCEAMGSEYAELSRLLSWPVASHPSTKLYTADGHTVLPIERTAIADRLARMLCARLDFPTLVRQVYADGARVFIELGANANCSKWIEDTLKNEPILSTAINRKGVDDHTSIVRLLAKLVTHQISLDLAPLYC